MQQTTKRWILLIVVAATVFALDQTAKWLTVEHLALGETWDPIQALAPVIRVMRSHNTGAAFGIFPLGSNVFLVLAVITSLVFIAIYPTLPVQALLSRIGIAMVIGGALSNAIDRVRYGYVVDYFHVQITPRYSNISNFADHAITIGVILLLVDTWLIERRIERAQTVADTLAATRLSDGFARVPFQDHNHGTPAGDIYVINEEHQPTEDSVLDHWQRSV